MITIKVQRFDEDKDSEPYFEEYEINETRKMKVLDALNYINNNYDTNLAFRSSCRAGQCGSCAIKMNGEVILACKAEITDNAILEPLDFPIIKDLIIDRSEIENKVREMQLYLDQCENRSGCPIILPAKKTGQTKKLRTCIECYSCLSACPVIKESSEFAGPYFMRYLSRFAVDPRDFGDRAKEGLAEGLYNCTTCGKCKAVCPKEIATPGEAIEKLRELAFKQDMGPLDAHKAFRDNVSTTGRSVEKLSEGFIEAVSQNTQNGSKPKVAFFTGCLVDYRLQKVGFALINVLKENGIMVDVPESQVCCGSPLIRTGQTDIVPDLVKTNTEALQDYDTIITVCAGCGSTLKNDYPKYGTQLNVLDISEFLLDKLDTDKMKPLNLRVTYHDPCHLVRGQGISQEPRELLKKIKGVEFVEMNDADKCCGSGGGVKAGKPELAKALGKNKAQNIKNADVDAVITICPFCQYHISDSLKEAGLEDTPVMNILELLEMAYQTTE